MHIQTLPMLSIALVDELERMFPARCINRSEDLRDADRYAAKRELVEFLISLRDTGATEKR